MILVDNALKARAEQGKPIRVGLLGSGFMGQGFRLTANVQYERWQIPFLAATRQSDVAVSVQFSFWPTPRKH